jgi:hypothetical protein
MIFYGYPLVKLLDLLYLLNKLRLTIRMMVMRNLLLSWKFNRSLISSNDASLSICASSTIGGSLFRPQGGKHPFIEALRHFTFVSGIFLYAELVEYLL